MSEVLSLGRLWTGMVQLCPLEAHLRQYQRSLYHNPVCELLLSYNLLLNCIEPITPSQILTVRRISGVRAKTHKATFLFINLSKAFDSIHRGKVEQILLTYGVPRETVAAIMMLSLSLSLYIYIYIYIYIWMCGCSTLSHENQMKN